MRLREMRVSYHAVPGTEGSGRKRITAPRDAAEMLMPLLQHESVEVMMLLLMDTKRQVLGTHVLSRGVLDTVLVHPREVFKVALLANAASLITAHNHPSGDPNPSPDDFTCWRRLNDAGDLMGVSVSDHLIITDGLYWSMTETGRRIG